MLFCSVTFLCHHHGTNAPCSFTSKTRNLSEVIEEGGRDIGLLA